MIKSFRRDRIKESFASYDKILTLSVAGLMLIGTLLVWAATKSWFASQGLDPQYYLKRHIINIFIGLVLAYGTTLIDYRMLRAYTPFVWGAGVLGLIAVLIPGIGSTVNGARAWISFPGGFQIQPAELAKIAIIVGCSMITGFPALYAEDEYSSWRDWVIREMAVEEDPDAKRPFMVCVMLSTILFEADRDSVTLGLERAALY